MSSVSRNTDLKRPVLKNDFDTIVMNKDADILRQMKKIQMLEEELEVIIIIYIYIYILLCLWALELYIHIIIHILHTYINVLDQTWFDVLYSVDCAESIIREMYQTTSCRNWKCRVEGKRLCATPGECWRGGGWVVCGGWECRYLHMYICMCVCLRMHAFVCVWQNLYKL